MDDNYWKDKYKGSWKKASERETWLKEYIEKETGLECVISGFGAGSDAYISGNAKTHGYEKGDPDITVNGTKVYIEVTGPLCAVPRNSALWFRPDKVDAAVRHREDDTRDTFMLNNFAKQDLWFVIHVDVKFSTNYKNGKYMIVNPQIKGSAEKYVEIPQNDECVCRGIESLISYLKGLKQ